MLIPINAGHSILGLLLWAIVGITVTASVNGVIAGFNAAEGESFDSAFAGGFVNGFILYRNNSRGI